MQRRRKPIKLHIIRINKSIDMDAINIFVREGKIYTDSATMWKSQLKNVPHIKNENYFSKTVKMRVL